jgi:hypothetical protein
MPGEVIRELLMLLRKKIPSPNDIRVSDVRIGLGYTGVRLNSGHLGVCHTSSDEHGCCQKVDRAGTLAGSSALETSELANSWNLGEAVVGVATINALSQIVLETDATDYSIIEGYYLDQIEITRDDTVALVGYIRPFIPVIKSKAGTLYVIERSMVAENEEVLPDTASEEILPKADVVILTGSTLVNGTIDRLLQLSKTAREVGVVGPTASMIPDPLFKRGATATAGIRVTNAERLLQVISEGGGVPQFKGACEQIVIKARTIK